MLFLPRLKILCRISFLNNIPGDLHGDLPERILASLSASMLPPDTTATTLPCTVSLKRAAATDAAPAPSATTRTCSAINFTALAVCSILETIDPSRIFFTSGQTSSNTCGEPIPLTKLGGCSISTGFPAGLSSFETRKKEITNSIKAGANEIDIVINRAYVLQNDWQRLYDEVRVFKEIAKEKKVKVILGVGDLETLRNVAKASLICMMAGADFIKTSTGKEKINANLNNSLVMLRMIREFYDYSGKKIGFKPAGGISTAKGVLEFLILMYEELGKTWINSSLLRIGASSLLIDIERQLYHFAEGRYANKEKMAMS